MIKLTVTNSNTGEELFTRHYYERGLTLERVLAKGEMYVKSENLNNYGEIHLRVSFDRSTERAY